MNTTSRKDQIVLLLYLGAQVFCFLVSSLSNVDFVLQYLGGLLLLNVLMFVLWKRMLEQAGHARMISQIFIVASPIIMLLIGVWINWK